MKEVITNSLYGKLKGEKTGNIISWKGIPYAKPPVGSLRFRAPEPPQPWEGIKDALAFSPAAPQPSAEIMNFLGNETEVTSEDCLYLNIWSPGADSKRRPVLVWIHGGAFISGSGSSSSYDGASFAEQGDVVTVTLNYRLGVFGFLHIGGTEPLSSGNFGLQDQVAALQWIQDNISAFGGDPDRITIFGESAGAMSIGTLLALPAAKGLFHQAILQSGAAANVITASKAEKTTKKILEYLQISEDEIDRLKELPADKLVEASAALPSMSLVPVVDGTYLPQHPETSIEKGYASDIPILIGTNKDEFRLFTFFDSFWKDPVPEQIPIVFKKTFGPYWETISEHFIKDGELNQSLYDKLMTLYVFNSPALRLAELQLRSGAPVWMYRFDWESPVLNGGLKSCHALEIPFVWNTLHKPRTERLTGDSPDRFTLGDQMHLALIAFAQNGDPNTEKLPTWKQYNIKERPVMLFNIESKLELDPDHDERIKWEKAISRS